MELTHTFAMAAPVDRAWAVVTDVERVAPLLPGATLLGIDGEDYRGVLEVKIGHVVARYEGVVRFLERDDAEHRAVLRAEGRDVRGQGDAAATIDVRLSARGAGTEVVVVTDLEPAGRVAGLGRGVIADVGGKVIGRFARRLDEETAAGAANNREMPVQAQTAVRSDAGIAVAARAALPAAEPRVPAATGGGAVIGLLRRSAVPLAAAVGVLVGWLIGRSRGGTR
jgi:carbon monoxide dehydrogenase subunit G